MNFSDEFQQPDSEYSSIGKHSRDLNLSIQKKEVYVHNEFNTNFLDTDIDLPLNNADVQDAHLSFGNDFIAESPLI